jgi:O-antigen ligase
VAQYEVAWDLFASSPLVGVGLGHPFVWIRVDGTTRSDITADTPLILPAKLGVLGIAWLALFIAVWIRFVQRLRRVAGVTIPGLAMTAWAAILGALAWGSFNPEDKGFSFALMLLLSLAFIEIERTASPERA